MAKKMDAPKRAEAVACGLIKALQGALEDPKQLYLYHVTERTDKGNETVERTFDKLDTKAAKEMTAMLRELTDILGISESKEKEAGGVILLPAEEEEKHGTV